MLNLSDKISDGMIENNPSQHLSRSLRNRHIQLIALGGTIGVGLFMGSGIAIQLAGPSIVFSYLIIGFLLFFVLRAIGEMLLSNLKYKSFLDIAYDQLGSGAGFFLGWTYWMCWIITCVAEIISITVYAQYWWPMVPPWIVATITITALIILNLASVRSFGEVEFWFSSIKIIATIVLVVCGLSMVSTHFVDQSGQAARVSNLWSHNGMFPHGISGFFAGFQLSIFAFVGLELIGTVAAETSDPHKSLPKAINAVPIRILLFYVSALLVIMMVTPWQFILPTQSPFVQLFNKTGFSMAASTINFVVLVAAASSSNGGLYCTSRVLYGLSHGKSAHKILGKLSKRGVPASGLFFSGLCLFVGAILLYLNPDIIEVFSLVTTAASILFIFVWAAILVSYLVYRKKQAELHAASTFKLPGGRFICWIVLFSFAFMLVLLSQRHETRIALACTPIWFIFLTLAFWVNNKIRNR